MEEVGEAHTGAALSTAEEAGLEARGGLLSSTFASLRHRDYRFLWLGSLFSSGGQWIQQVTLGWLTYEVTGSAFLLGAVNGLRALPMLILAPFGGVAADRVDMKRLMLTTQVFLMAVSALFASIVVTGNAHLWNIIPFTVLTGVAWAFNLPVRQSLVVSLVPRRDLMNAIALNSAGLNITRVLGPSAAGVLIGTIGLGGNFYLQSLTYLGVALMIWQMQVPSLVRPTGGESSLRQLAEGASYAWSHPTLRAQMSLALIPMLLGLPFLSLLPVFAKDVLEVGNTGFGVLHAAVGAGAVVGTLVIASLTSIRRKGLVLFGALITLGAALILFSESRSFPLSLALLLLVGAAQMAYAATNQTLLQMSIPDEMRGRVMGIYTLNMGLVPLGALIAGTLASLTSAPAAGAVMGTCLLAFTALAFLTMPSLREA